jgi:hypothetical protein
MGVKRHPNIYLLAVALGAACFSASAAKRPADGRLAYVQYLDKGCQVGVWDSKTRDSRILGSLAECPAAVSVTSHERALVLMYRNAIRLVDLASGTVGELISMPADAPGKGLDMEESLAGYTADGTLAMRLRGSSRDMPSFVQLFLYKDGSWKKVAEKPCRDYDECAVQPAIEARPLDDIYGLGPNGLFDESLTGDPYVVRRSARDARPDASADEGEPDQHRMPTQVTLTFHVDGKDSKMVFNTIPGEDTDGIYTFGLKLKLPDSRVLTIVDSDQFGAALVGRYLLYHGFFGNGVRLYDVGTGEVVLDKLSTGGWLESSPLPPNTVASPSPRRRLKSRRSAYSRP